MMTVRDGSPRSLTLKVLERPRFVERLRRLVGDPACAYLTCYNATALERELAVALDVPLNGTDPALLHLGSKSGNRRVFRAAGVAFPDGSEDLRSEDDILDALAALGERQPELRRAVVKINDTRDLAGEEQARASPRLERTSPSETIGDFLRKYAAMGGIVEAFVEMDEVRSPSVQMRIFPNGEPSLVSSHEQVLGGATGQSYLGCRFPADNAYRTELLRETEKIGRVLADAGVVGRFGVDWLVGRGADGNWRATAIEINLRMGGTTPPYLALEFLTGGALEQQTGLFHAPDGTPKFYTATDNLKSPDYRRPFRAGLPARHRDRGALPHDRRPLPVREGRRHLHRG